MSFPVQRSRRLRRSEAIRKMVQETELSAADFSLMLRNVTEQDEWLLLLHGAVLGFGAGMLHLVIFG